MHRLLSSHYVQMRGWDRVGNMGHYGNLSLNFPKTRLWTSNVHHITILHNEKYYQRLAGEHVVMKCRPLSQGESDLALITFNENAKDSVISLFQTTTVTTEQKALDQLTSAEEKPNKSVSSSFTSSCNAVKSSIGNTCRQMVLTVGHLYQQDKQEYMVTGVAFYIIFIKSTGIWTLTFVMTEFEN